MKNLFNKSREISKYLCKQGFHRSDDRTDDESLKKFLGDIFGGDEEFYNVSQPEVYIAPASLFGIRDKKYSVFIRNKNRR